MQQIQACPKCQHENTLGSNSCEKCGIVFQKFKSPLISCSTCQKEFSRKAPACPQCGEPNLASMPQKKKRVIKPGQFVCRNCGHIGKPKLKTKGNILIELLLWLCFLLPGLIYSLYRLFSKKKVCPKCEATNMIPGDSPMAKNLLAFPN